MVVRLLSFMPLFFLFANVPLPAAAQECMGLGSAERMGCLARLVGPPPIAPAEEIPLTAEEMLFQETDLTADQIEQLLFELEGVSNGAEIAEILRRYGLNPADPKVQGLFGVDANGNPIPGGGRLPDPTQGPFPPLPPGTRLLNPTTGQESTVDIREQDGAGDGHFGACRDSGCVRAHGGVDIVTRPGDTVYAPTTGTVTRIIYPYGQGSPMRGIEIRGDNGVTIKIMYMDPTGSVKPGDRVTGGQVVGRAQDVRQHYPNLPSMTPHLHFETWVGGKKRNPCEFFTSARGCS